MLGCLLLGGGARLRAQEQNPVQNPSQSEDQSETQSIVADPNRQLFTVLAAINVAGYDEGMDEPELVPLRAAVREELAQRTIPVLADLREFYQRHQFRDPDQNLSQYVSLALFLSAPPELARLGHYAEGMRSFIAGDYERSVQRLSDWIDAMPSTREVAYAPLALSAVSRIGRLLGDDDSPAIEAAAEALSSRIEHFATLSG